MATDGYGRRTRNDGRGSHCRIGFSCACTLRVMVASMDMGTSPGRDDTPAGCRSLVRPYGANYPGDTGFPPASTQPRSPEARETGRAMAVRTACSLPMIRTRSEARVAAVYSSSLVSNGDCAGGRITVTALN